MVQKVWYLMDKDLVKKLKAFEGRKDQRTYTRKDVYVNAFSGFGGAKDPIMRTAFMGEPVLTQQELEELYRHFWLARSIVNSISEDACRQRIKLNIEDPNISTAVSSLLEDLSFWPLIEEGLRLARLYGGAVMIIGALDGQKPYEPLDLKKIARIASLTVLDRWQLSPAAMYDDPLAPGFGSPKTYRLHPVSGAALDSGRLIHESRLIRFNGAWLPERTRIANNGWHDSVLTAANQALKHFGTSLQAGAVLFQDFITKVLKIPNLAQMISDGNEDVLWARIQYAISNMSSLGVSLVGEGEEFSKIQTPITGLVELIDKYMDFAAAASGIPKTRLFGQQLGTLAGADETTRNYYDLVKGYQQKNMRQPIMRMIDLILAESKKSGTDYSFEFAPLWQPTDKELAETRKIMAETDQIYISNQVLQPEEVALARFGPDGYSMETVIDTDSDESDAGAADPDDQDSVEKVFLNGAQVTSLINLVASVGKGEVSRETAIEVIVTSFPIPRPVAEKIIAEKVAVGPKVEKEIEAEPKPEPDSPEGQA